MNLKKRSLPTGPLGLSGWLLLTMLPVGSDATVLDPRMQT